MLPLRQGHSGQAACVTANKSLRTVTVFFETLMTAKEVLEQFRAFVQKNQQHTRQRIAGDNP